MKAKDIHSGRRIFHFTNQINLPEILRDGIDRGEVPISPTDIRQAPNLTSSPNARAQAWAVDSNITDKTKMRLTVRIPGKDERLETWLSISRRLRSPTWWQRRLDPTGQAKFWFVFWGTIPPEWITVVEIRNDDDTYSTRSGEVLDALVRDIVTEREEKFNRRGKGPDAVLQLKPGVEDSWLLDGPAVSEEARLALQIRNADVVVGVDTNDGHGFLLYGRKAIDEAVAEGAGRELKFLRVDIDQRSAQLEWAIALVEMVKGSHDYPGGTTA
jgi:hypothetical protein